MGKKYQNRHHTASEAFMQLRKVHGLHKITYIFTYYKLHIGLILLIIIGICSITHAIHVNLLPVSLYINLYSDTADDYEDWFRSFAAGFDDAGQTVFYEQNSFFTESSMMSGSDENYLSTRVAAREQDIIISTRELFAYMYDHDMLYSLDTLLSDERLSLWGGQIISDAAGTPYGIALTETEFPEAAAEEYILFVCTTTEHPEAVITYIDNLKK